MFIQKPTRTHLIVIAVAAMLVLAGCAEHGSPGADTGEVTVVESGTPESLEPSETPTPEEDSNSSPLDRDDYGLQPGQNLAEYANDLDLGSAGLNDSGRQRVEDMIIGFYDGVENESERRTFFLEKAEKHCEFDQKYEEELDKTMLEEGSGELNDAVRRAEYAGQIVGEFNGEPPVNPLGDIGDGVSEVTKHAPLVGSYNQMSEKACDAAEDRTDEAIREYQIASMMFGVDAMLVSTGAFYQPAFASTRFVTNRASQLGLYRLRYVCGNRCWALAMSEVHVALRGSMLTVTSNMLRTAADMGVQLTQEDLDAVADAHGMSGEELLASEYLSNESEVQEALSEGVLECGEAVTESGDDDGLFGDGISTDEVLDKGKDVVDGVGELVEECRGG